MSEHSKKLVRMQDGNSVFLSEGQRSNINKIIAFVRDYCKKKGYATYKAISTGTKINEHLVSKYVMIASHIENPLIHYNGGKQITKSGVKTYQKVTFKKRAYSRS